MEGFVDLSILDSLLVQNTNRMKELLEDLQQKKSRKKEDFSQHSVIEKIVKLLNDNPEKVEIIAEGVVNWILMNNIQCTKLNLNVNFIEDDRPIESSHENTTLKNKMEETTEIWTKLCNKFDATWRKTLCNLLSLEEDSSLDNLKSCEYLIKYYCVLFDSNDVWKLYKKTRRDEFVKYLKTQKKIDVSNNKLCLSISEKISDKLLQLIPEDARISKETKNSSNDEYLIETYLDSLSDYFLGLVKEISEINNAKTNNNLISENVGSCSWKEIVLLDEDSEGSTNSNQKIVVDHVVNLLLMCGKIEEKLRSCLKEFVFSREQETIEKSSLKNKSSQASNISSSSTHIWEWRFMFVLHYSELSQFIDDRIRTVTLSSLDEENTQLKINRQVETFSFCRSITDCDWWHPTKVSLSLNLVSDVIQETLKIAEICGGELSSVKNAFTMSVKQYLVQVINHIIRLSQQNLQNQINFLVILSSSLHLEHCLENAQQKIKDDLLFSTEINQLKELTETLTQRIKIFHKSFLCSTIFHDAESHDWKSNKSFHEDEKCSFSVEMWTRHVKQLKFDLSTICCSNHTIEILLDVMNFSLSWFASRYSRASPNFSRVDQVRRDITCVLLFTSEIISSFPASSNLQLIHHHCNALLAVVVVVTSPLKTLHKVYKNGFVKSNKENWTTTSWMNIMVPSLWNGKEKEVCDLGRKLKSVCSSFAPSWNNVIELLLMNDCLLSSTLLSHVIDNSISQDENTTEITFCHLNYTHSELCSTGYIDVVDVIFTILAHCNSIPNALTMVVKNLLNKFNFLGRFVFSNSEDEELPKWILTLRGLLSPFCLRLVTPIIFKIHNQSSASRKDVEDIIKKISGEKKLTGFRLNVNATASSLVDNFLKSLNLISPVFIFLFDSIEKQLSDSDKKMLICNSVMVHVLANHIYRLMTTHSTKNSEQENNLKEIGREFLEILKRKEKIELMVTEPEEDKETEILYSASTWEITNNKKVFTALQKLLKLINLNQKWILVNLGLEKSEIEFQTVVTANFQYELNPLKQSFDQALIRRHPFTWRSLLESGVGLNETSFRLLLRHRWEFLENAQLSEQEEQKHAKRLSDKFDLN